MLRGHDLQVGHQRVERGVALAGCFQNTGEGGLSEHHLQGGELVFQIGTGYFGCRDEAGRFSLERLRELQDYVDAQNGGPGKGWFRIVKSPAQARRVVNAGKLAVVMGIEVSKLFDCGVQDGQPDCTAAQVDARLKEVYDLGVRSMEIVNKFNNGFAGVAGDTGAIRST